ncbi:hypothetical protein [Rhodococcus pyridinivorans]|uniref:hypothetical protein n=1 Tax=Rhodococcus pyridinivorans TaxID=103816 RepID=UPI003AAF8211
MTRTRLLLAVPAVALALAACNSETTETPDTTPGTTTSFAAQPETDRVSDDAGDNEQSDLCASMTDYFTGMQELRGESYDPNAAAEEWIAFVQSPDAEANWDRADGPPWSEMTPAEQTEWKSAAQSAANGEC